MDKGKDVNAEKKEHMREYQSHVRRINRIEAELEELRAIKTGSSIGDGMPHGSKQTDLSDYISRLSQLEQDLKKERYRRIMAYQDISESIKRLQSENEKDVLFYRYIKGMDWWEIAEKMKFSERQIFRIHGQALTHIVLEKMKDVSECQ